MTRHQLFVLVFRAFWYGLVPLALAIGAIAALSPFAMMDNPLGSVAFFVQDQKVPALIVFFTIFEMLIYRARHSLPLAHMVGVAGRRDIPAAWQRSYEEAVALVEEARRIQRAKRKDLERNVKASVREKLTEAVDDLRDVLEATPFVAERFTESYTRAATAVSQTLSPWRKGETQELLESVGIAFLIAIALRVFVVQAFKIPSGSMLPTLQISDHIFVNKFEYGVSIPGRDQKVWSRQPRYGDIIVFKAPDPVNGGQDFIKRVVGRECDVIEVSSGHPRINGWSIPKCYVGEIALDSGPRAKLYVQWLDSRPFLAASQDDAVEQGPYRVKRGEVFVMGDNRNNSSDSREWFGRRGGGVPVDDIRGRALFVWLSFLESGVPSFSRSFHDVNTATLPSGAPRELVDGITACLAKAPAQSVPPAPSRDSRGGCTYELAASAEPQPVPSP